jgi:hypothetical protein
MPCNSSDGMGHRTDPAAQRKIDDLTRMLCSLLRALDGKVALPPDVADWYRAHQSWDRSQGRP